MKSGLTRNRVYETGCVSGAFAETGAVNDTRFCKANEEKDVQREQVLEQALGILELNGLAATTSLAMMAENWVQCNRTSALLAGSRCAAV